MRGRKERERRMAGRGGKLSESEGKIWQEVNETGAVWSQAAAYNDGGIQIAEEGRQHTVV